MGKNIESKTFESFHMTSENPYANGVPSQQQTSAMAVTSLPISVQNAQNSPDLANMTVGQLLGQAQRRISITHVQSAAKLSTSGIAAQRGQPRQGTLQATNPQLARTLQGGGMPLGHGQQQSSSSADSAPINRPVFQSYRFEDRTSTMPTRKLITTVDQHDTYYKIEPGQDNQAIPISSETVYNEQRIAHSSVNADQVRQVAFPYRQNTSTSHGGEEQQVTTQNGRMEQSGTGSLLEWTRLDDLVKQIDPTSVLEDSVKDALLEFVDDFVEQVIDRSCKLSRHRGSTTLEAKDVEFILQRYFKIPQIPRSGGIGMINKNERDGHASENSSRSAELTAHNQRIALIKKTLKKV